MKSLLGRESRTTNLAEGFVLVGLCAFRISGQRVVERSFLPSLLRLLACALQRRLLALRTSREVPFRLNNVSAVMKINSLIKHDQTG